MIDTHCHLDVAAFDADRAAVVERAIAAGVVGILVPAIRPRTWPGLRALASGTVKVAFGVHPQIVPELDADERGLDLVAAIARATTDADAVAVGECGLDGGTGERDLQEAMFRAHVRAARAVRKPLVIHVLGGGHDRALAILREERAGEVGGVMHSYSGSAELVRDYAALGLAFSFAGAVTRPNAKRPLAAVRAVPLDLLLVETDAPDQLPSDVATRTGDIAAAGPPDRPPGTSSANAAAAGSSPARHARNEPALLPRIVAAVAAARGATAETIAAATAANARSRFAAW